MALSYWRTNLECHETHRRDWHLYDQSLVEPADTTPIAYQDVGGAGLLTGNARRTHFHNPFSLVVQPDKQRGWQLVIPLRYVDLNYAFQDRRGAKMQWRSILVGLVVLRLSLSCMLWLAFGLGPSWGFNFHLGFNLHKLDLLFREEKETEPRDNSWSERIHGPRYEETETTCASAGEESPKRSYLSFFDGNKDEYVRRYSSFPDTLKAKMKDMAKEMFYFGYDNYMKYAFPEDELNPIDCEGRGPDVQNPWVIHCYPDYLNWLDLLLWNAVHASRRSVILTVFCTLQFACNCNQTGL